MVTHSPLAFAEDSREVIVGYVVTDHVSKAERRYTRANQRKAYAFADKRDNAYGAVICSVRAVWGRA